MSAGGHCLGCSFTPCCCDIILERHLPLLAAISQAMQRMLDIAELEQHYWGQQCDEQFLAALKIRRE